MARFITRQYLVNQFQGFFDKVVKPLIKGTVAKIKVNGELVEMDTADRSVNIEIPEGAEYSLAKAETATEGFLATYHLTKNGENVGEAINIPKDYLVKDAEVKIVETENEPVEGYAVGDKYIDFTVNTKNKDGNETHLYINVGDLVEPLALADTDPDTDLVNPLCFEDGRLIFKTRNAVAGVEHFEQLSVIPDLARKVGTYVQVWDDVNTDKANGLYRLVTTKGQMVTVMQDGVEKNMLMLNDLSYLVPEENVIQRAGAYVVRSLSEFYEFEPHSAGYSGPGNHDAFRIYNKWGTVVDDGGDATAFVFEPPISVFSSTNTDRKDCYVWEKTEQEEIRNINFGEGARPDVVINL